jgi:protein dithiol:quinone oxidoreductase
MSTELVTIDPDRRVIDGQYTPHLRDTEPTPEPADMQALFTDTTPQGHTQRTWLVLVALWSTALLAYGLYLQHVDGLEPCPMCIVQRYALVGVVVLAAMGAWCTHKGAPWLWSLFLATQAFAGAFVAARQSWLQWYPPEVYACGRDFYGMIEAFPLKKVIPMLFKGSGDCTAVDWTFLSLTIANWSFLNFMAMGLIGLWLLVYRLRAR